MVIKYLTNCNISHRIEVSEYLCCRFLKTKKEQINETMELNLKILSVKNHTFTNYVQYGYGLKSSQPGIHFSKDPETFQACKAIFSSSVSLETEKCMHLKLLV